MKQQNVSKQNINNIYCIADTFLFKQTIMIKLIIEKFIISGLVYVYVNLSYFLPAGAMFPRQEGFPLSCTAQHDLVKLVSSSPACSIVVTLHFGNTQARGSDDQ